MEENGRHLLHEFMTGQRRRPKPNKWVNRTLWTLILILLGALVHLLYGEFSRHPREQPGALNSKPEAH